MQVIRFEDSNYDKKLKKAFSRKYSPNEKLKGSVEDIIESVRSGGDKAVRTLTKKFDKVDIKVEQFELSRKEILSSSRATTNEVKQAIKLSNDNVTSFALSSMRKDWSTRNSQGVLVGEVFQPFNSVGIYVPGGSAPLVSTSLMTVAIAKAVNVPNIVVCTPPGPNGMICPELVYALKQSGATSIFRVGGAQAIAAMSIGTKTINKVDKVFGPGNSFVVEAKRQLFGDVSVDLLPGPSEVFVLADSSGKASWIASDLLAQAEHGGDSNVAFVTTSSKLLDEVAKELKTQSKQLSRQFQVKEVLKKGTNLVLVKSINEGVRLANEFAPEHLSLVVKNPNKIIPKITTSGAIFVGPYSAVAIGDFLAGPSHTLPTGGAGKSFSGLTADMFQRRTSVIDVSKNALKKSSKAVDVFSRIEGLDAHGKSVSIRNCD